MANQNLEKSKELADFRVFWLGQLFWFTENVSDVNIQKFIIHCHRQASHCFVTFKKVAKSMEHSLPKYGGKTMVF